MKKVIYLIIYTQIQWAPAVFETNPEWVKRGTVTPENIDNDKIAKQIIAKANELVKQNQLKSRNIPVWLKTATVPKNMQ